MRPKMGCSEVSPKRSKKWKAKIIQTSMAHECSGSFSPWLKTQSISFLWCFDLLCHAPATRSQDLGLPIWDQPSDNPLQSPSRSTVDRCTIGEAVDMLFWNEQVPIREQRHVSRILGFSETGKIELMEKFLSKVQASCEWLISKHSKLISHLRVRVNWGGQETEVLEELCGKCSRCSNCAVA